MTDTLDIFGKRYNNVTGIIATDSNSDDLTYVNTSDANATQYSLLEGATAYVNGAKITGVIPQMTQYTGDMSQDFHTENNQRKWSFEGIIRTSQGGMVNPGASFSTGEYTYNAVPANTTITPTTSSQTVGGANYMMEGAVTVSAVPTGTAGTPTATKGSVSNHSVTVTPSVTNTTGYITGSTKTGTAVTVSASELVSGSETKTANGTYDVTNLQTLVVNVSGGGSSKNAQTAQSTTRSTSTTYTEVITLTCTKAGKYHVYWSTFRSSTSGTWGSQLYINDNAYGTAQTGSWSNHIQNIHLSNVQISANAEVAVRVRSRGSNYYGYVGTLTIIEA